MLQFPFKLYDVVFRQNILHCLVVSACLLAVNVQTLECKLQVTVVNIIVIRSEDLVETASRCCYQNKSVAFRTIMSFPPFFFFPKAQGVSAKTPPLELVKALIS